MAVKITLAQVPAPAGEITGNSQSLLDVVDKAAADGVEVLVIPAHSIAGDAGDLFRDPDFSWEATAATHKVRQAAANGEVMLCDAPVLALSTAADGTQVASVEVTDPSVLPAAVRTAALRGADVVAISAAVPYRIGAPEARRAELCSAARQHQIMVAFCNRVGGQDANVYDGGSLLIGNDGQVIYQSPLFAQETVTLTVDPAGPVDVLDSVAWPPVEEQVWTALVTGTRDYVLGNGFTDIVIGLSGGIDSAVVAAIGVDALGAEHVHGLGMPGPYSSEGSVTDARLLAGSLGIRFDLAPITKAYRTEVETLGNLLNGPGAQVAKENIQARLRSLHLFTVANARNALVLNTCNKSEDAVGYATYGGDSLGAYAPLADLLKGWVYRLAHWRNTISPVIPSDTLGKAPSAELAPGQQDADTLPPYDLLDTIIERYLTYREEPEEIVAHVEGLLAAEGRDAAADVDWVLTMIDRSEWKRQQAPLGPHLSADPFALRQVPVTNRRRRYRHGR